MTVAVDIGGSSIKIARIVGDPPRPPDTVTTVATPSHLGEIIATITAPITALGPVERIGVGCAGLVDRTTGVARWMPHAAGRQVPLLGPLQEHFGVPVAVDNDANLAALAEARHGAGVGARVVMMVVLGTGIGAGLVIDGQIERGRGGLGEVGHMRLADGPDCSCGATGCWETLVSGRAMDANATELLGVGSSAADLVRAAAGGAGPLFDAVERAGWWLGVGIGNLIAAIDPDVVVLGGGAMAAGDALIRPASRYLGARGGGLALAGIPPLRPAAFGSSAGLVGGAIAAREVQV